MMADHLSLPGMQVDGQAHVVHSEEEPQGTRVTIDSLTCLLANEADPSRLLAASPGKLVRYLVEDGSRVQPDQPYAEVEVSVLVDVSTALHCTDYCICSSQGTSRGQWGAALHCHSASTALPSLFLFCFHCIQGVPLRGPHAGLERCCRA